MGQLHPSHPNLHTNNTWVPECPTNAPQNFPYPSSSILFCVLTVEAFLLAAVVSFKYNSVKVFNKKIRTEIISNNFWIFYFLLVGVRSMAEVLRLGLSNTLTQYTYYKYFDWIVLAFYGIGALALSLALNYQRKYRSSASEQQKPKEKKGMERDGSVININANANGTPNGMNGHTAGAPGMNRPTSPTGARPGTPLLPPQPNQPDLEMSMTDSIKKHLGIIEIFFFMLFIAFVVTLVLTLVFFDNPLYWWIFVGLLCSAIARLGPRCHDHICSKSIFAFRPFTV